MADGLEPTETLTSFERYNELGVNDDDAGSGDEYNAANFRSAPNWNELRKGADLVLLLVIDCLCSTQNSDVDDDRDTEDDQVKDYKSGSNICGNNRWNAVGSS